MLSDEVKRVSSGVSCPRCHSFSISVIAYPVRAEVLPRPIIGYMSKIKCGQCGEESISRYGKDILEGVRYCVKEWRKENV